MDRALKRENQASKNVYLLLLFWYRPCVFQDKAYRLQTETGNLEIVFLSSRLILVNEGFGLAI